jgi:hypothetical protein
MMEEKCQILFFKQSIILSIRMNKSTLREKHVYDSILEGGKIGQKQKLVWLFFLGNYSVSVKVK